MTHATIFTPKNGAPIDLDTLSSIADTQSMLLDSSLSFVYGEDPRGLVISGLEPNGRRPKKNGPPGVMQFSLLNFSLSSGCAIVGSSQGWQVVRFEESQLLQFEEPERSSTLRSVVIALSEQDGTKNGDSTANKVLTPMVSVVNKEDVDSSLMTIVANELAPNIWSTDVERIASGNHPILESMMNLFNQLEDVIWESDRHGEPWQVQRLGREWKTYQSKASVAVTAARFALSNHPSTTEERVRCLTNLHWQLQRSVEQAAQTLAKWTGVVEAADKYAPVFSAPPADWDAMS